MGYRKMTVHHIFLLEKNGIPIHSMCIDHSPASCSLGMMDESLAGGFLSAIESFGEELGAGALQELKSDKFNLIFGLSKDSILIFEVAPTDYTKKYDKVLKKCIEFLDIAYYEGFAAQKAQKEKFIGRFRKFLDNFKETRAPGAEYSSERAGFFRKFISTIKEKIRGTSK